MPLTTAFAEELVMDELRKVDNVSRFDVIVDTPRLPLGNQERQSTEIKIEDLNLDAASGRFSAVLVGMVGVTPRFQLPLRGRAQPLMSIPVLMRNVGRGEQISADDLDWIDLAPNKLPKGALTDPDHIIGTEASAAWVRACGDQPRRRTAKASARAPARPDRVCGWRPEVVRAWNGPRRRRLPVNPSV